MLHGTDELVQWTIHPKLSDLLFVPIAELVLVVVDADVTSVRTVSPATDARPDTMLNLAN